MNVSSARRLLTSRATLSAHGLTSRSIRTAVDTGILHRVDHGWYAQRSEWNALRAEERHLLRVVAAHARLRSSTNPFSFTSAAVLHELPLYRVEPARVHMSGSNVDGRVSTASSVAHHEVLVAADDIVHVSGIACTSVARTVADVIRQLPPPAGLSVADAALRSRAWNDGSRTYDVDRAEQLRDEVARRIPSRGRGIVRARRVIVLADGRAQLPGESVSRLWLHTIGFAAPRLQVPVPNPWGGNFYVDFGLDDVNAWGEFDGQGKYRDEALRSGRSLEEVLLAEKQREDWIRGTTGRRMPRWSMEHIDSAVTLERRLASFGIMAPCSR